MLSQKLEKIVADIEATAVTATQRESAVDLRARLRDCAQRMACYRCDKAGFVIVWNDKSKDMAKHDWYTVLTVCHSWHSLPKDDYFGMHLPAAQFFCSDEESKAQGGSIDATFDDFEASTFASRSSGQRETSQQPREEREGA